MNVPCDYSRVNGVRIFAFMYILVTLYTCSIQVQHDIQSTDVLKCCVSHSKFPILQLISSEASYIKFLLTLCDFAVLHKHIQLRDSVRGLLKLLPTGRGSLSPLCDSSTIWTLPACWLHLYIVVFILYVATSHDSV